MTPASDGHEGAERSKGTKDIVIVVYSPAYRIDIGTHVFPTHKYELLS